MITAATHAQNDPNVLQTMVFLSAASLPPAWK
jgi:hypothetical protein